MKILIIGCGYVGKAAAKHWKEAGHEITATTRNPERLSELKATADHVFLLKGSKREAFRQALEGQEAVLLSVAPDKQQTADYEKTYLHTAEELADALKEHAQVKQLLYTSSISVYGDKGGRWIDESEPLAPSNRSTEFLAKAEEVLLALETPLCILRLGEIYGPGREFANRLHGRSFPFPGTGQQYINIIHLENIVNALDFCLKKELFGIFNLTEEIHCTRKEFYESLADSLSLPSPHWDPALKSLHGGNKRISSNKIINTGFNIKQHF